MTDIMKYQESVLRLPSCGLAYDDAKLKLTGNNDSIAVRKWTVNDNRDVQGVIKSADIHKVYSFLLGRVLVEPNPRSTNLDQFLMSDVLSIMYMCKIFTWGPMADFPYTCACNTEQMPTIDLGQMLCKYADEDVPNYKAKGLDVMIDGRKLTVHLPTLADELKIQLHMKGMHRSGRVVDDETDTNYVRSAVLIDAVDDKPMPYIQDKFNMIMGWDMASVRDLNKFLNKRDTGILMDQYEVNCTMCARRNTLSMSLTPAFFRPPVVRSDDNGEESEAVDVREFELARHGSDDDSGLGRSLPDSDSGK